MIVSALVVTSERAAELLAGELRGDIRLEVGVPNKHFLPVVTTTESLKSSRELYEDLRGRPGVVDVQLVSWADESALLEGSTSAELARAKEKE